MKFEKNRWLKSHKRSLPPRQTKIYLWDAQGIPVGFYLILPWKKTDQSLVDMKKRGSWFSRAPITREKAQGSGMAVVLILLVIGLITKEETWYKIAIGALLMDMVFPMFYFPFALLWYGLADIMGSVASRILLTVIYLVIVLPVALVRRISGKDPLLLGKFKKGTSSVMKIRNHIFTAQDLEEPF